MATHSINLLRLYELVERSVANRALAKGRQDIYAALADILLDKGVSAERVEINAHLSFVRMVYADHRTLKSGLVSRTISVTDDDIRRVFSYFTDIGVDNFGDQKQFRNHIYAPTFDDGYDFPRGSIEDREIQIADGGTSVFRAELSSYPPVGEYINIEIDRVFLLQHNADGNESIAVEKHYIRISPTNRAQGAVILPVDEATGRVMLVSQFRHPQRKWMTELPRGFADLADKTSAETAERELGEETGLVPKTIKSKWLGDIKAQLELRSLYTDSGKLTENPGYFITFVDADAVNLSVRRLQPLMENPVWVDLRAFYCAVRTGESIAGETPISRIEFYAKHFKPKTRLDDEQPVLEIDDAFTTNAANLAKPILLARYPEIAEQILADDREWADAQLSRLAV